MSDEYELTMHDLAYHGVLIRLRAEADRLREMVTEGVRLDRDHAPSVLQRELRNATMLQRRKVTLIVAEAEALRRAHNLEALTNG
jgi:hypothetical protein